MSHFTSKGLDSLRRSKIGEKNPQFIANKELFRSYEWLFKKYIVEELSLDSLSRIADVSPACICKWMNKVGIKRRKFCGMRGARSSSWRGGRHGGKGKYVYVYSPNHPRSYRRHVPEHVLVAEKILGRFLNGDEIIHHINHRKDDNRPENLYLFQDEHEHMRYHQKFRKGSSEEIKRSNML